MVNAVHPDLYRQLAADRHEQLRRTAHVARLARQARAARRQQRRWHRYRDRHRA